MYTHAYPQTVPTPHSGPPQRPTRTQQAGGCRRAFPRMNNSPRVTCAVTHKQGCTYWENTPPQGKPAGAPGTLSAQALPRDRAVEGLHAEPPVREALTLPGRPRKAVRKKPLILMDLKAREKEELFSDSRPGRERGRRSVWGGACVIGVGPMRSQHQDDSCHPPSPAGSGDPWD